MIWLIHPLIGRGYQFWSGIGSDFSEIAIIGAVLAHIRHHNCSIPHCPRIAHKKYEIKETKQYTCRKHHTQYWHDLLVEQYKEDYPEQHEFINKEVT